MMMSSAKVCTEFEPAGFFVLRAPLLPFAALPACRADLRELLARPEVREAIYVAAPSLDSRLEVWFRDADSDAARKIEQALTRYVARMSGRATPFGLFAGCAVGRVGPTTRLAVEGSCGRHTRLDMDYVVALCDALSRDPQLRPYLRFAPNTSLYRINGRARYLELRRQDKAWSHHRASLAVPDYLNAVLNRAADGATPGELIQVLRDHDPAASGDEAAEYVSELIDQQILVSELVPAITGPEPIHGLIERLQQLPNGAGASEQLEWARDELHAMDDTGPGVSPERYLGVAKRLAGLPAIVDESRLFQVDLVQRSAGATLGSNVFSEIARGVELLRRLTPRPVDDPLTAFHQSFIARFGDTPVTREVPLADALDDETGVGFGDARHSIEASLLLEGLPLTPPAEGHVAWGPRENWLLARLTESLAVHSGELTLTPEDIERLSIPNPLPLPDAFAVMARLEAASGEAVGRGDFRLYLASVSGPSGARLLGRFCHADPELGAAVADHLRTEETLHPETVFAEVVHLPEGRLGNILARPVCRPYEIPYLGRSGAPAERVLPLSDLTVSVRGPRVILRSRQLAREVVPRLTSAHNFAASHGVYRFLCALQGQGIASGLGWTWGPLMGSAYLPRVTYGRLVLARAQWRVRSAEIKTLLALTAEIRWAAVQLWRTERRLPRWVCLSEGDNELPIDLDNRLMVEMLLGELRGRDSMILIEMFPAPDQLCLEGPDGRRVHELVVPFARQPGAERERRDRPAPAQCTAAPTCRRMFPPGSDWLTIKLYAGSIAVDHLLRDVVGPLAIRFVREGLARRWFFVRYADPHSHLRLRFQGEPDVLNIRILPHVQAAVAPLLADGRIWKMQLDTYEREVERYGGPVGIELCEQLFHHDTEAVIELLRLLADDQRGDRRWRFALLGMDRLLNDLGLDPDARQQLLRRLRESARLESGIEGEASRRLSAKYRNESTSVEALLDFSAGAEWAAARSIFDSRTQRNGAPVSELQRLARLGPAATPIADLAASLLHMHANRLLRSAQRMHETVLYDFLFRYDQRTQSLHRNRTACGSGYVV